MQTNGNLSQERYWLYIDDEKGKYACLRDKKPYRLCVFRTEEDGEAHAAAYLLLKSLRGYWVDRNEVLIIASFDFNNNYVVLDESDIYLLKAQTAEKYRYNLYNVKEL